ncbi:HNH endonuclease [Candidatus Thiomargarita nelsonii]|uniref:HNH endonuclease n=1 Tax=Candidatus Thiomargarita nelsonii TaxID=1003181 RepID=A0A176S795_9GAMM|nr:HNH endonuclease [Candidatus Thiomargarita nelsonii]
MVIEMVYVISKKGEVLMPTKRHGKVRKWLKEAKAKVVNRAPFTIQLLFDTGTETQPVTLGIDSGYTYIGFSAVTEIEEVLGGELTLLDGISERLTKRVKYRRARRNRLRHRKPGFLKDTKREDWLAPSIQHKLDSHIKFIEKIKSILPVTKVIVEVANFDIQKIKNSDIQGNSYQEGEQKGFSDLREYILHRDNHKCQNTQCKGKSKILEIHHLGYWKKDRSDRPSNLIALCSHCHTANNHQTDGFLYGWNPKLKGFREATFMSMVRWKLVKQLNCEQTYGALTKYKRKELGLEKSRQPCSLFS